MFQFKLRFVYNLFKCDLFNLVYCIIHVPVQLISYGYIDRMYFIAQTNSLLIIFESSPGFQIQDPSADLRKHKEIICFSKRDAVEDRKQRD